MDQDEEMRQADNDFGEMCIENVNDFGLDSELIARINEQKRDGMFVSAWQEDETDVFDKDLNSPTEAFLTAAEEGLIEDVKKMLEADSSMLNASDCDGYTALHRASYNNHLDVVSYLLDQGANIESRSDMNWTPLHSASNWANYEVVGLLLSHNANPNLRSNGSLTPLHIALSSKEDAERIFHTVRYLLQAPGIDLSAISGAGDTPLDLARRNNPQCFDLISEKLQRI